MPSSPVGGYPQRYCTSDKGTTTSKATPGGVRPLARTKTTGRSEIKFFYPNGRWWHIPGNWRARPSGVRVNAIAAGPVLTNGAAPDRIEALGATTLLARPAQPGEMASVIAFLASPKASYITGAVIAADGGRTAI